MEDLAIKKIIAEHKELVAEVMKKFSCNEKIADKAMSLASEFNLRDKQDGMEMIEIIVYTLKRLKEDGNLKHLK